MNIKLEGKILYSVAPEAATEIIQISKSFYQLASKALKESDNYITDYLLAEHANNYGINNWRKAGTLIGKYVSKKYNIDLTNSVIVDGSGLSRYNMLTPNQFDDFLVNVYKDQDFINIKSMLATPSEQEYLEKRFEGMSVFAKTGGMTSILSIVGYVFDEYQTPYSFVIVSNNFFGPSKKYKDMEENVIKLLLKEN
ncbi:MAG: D-alanyl-D-alanine carboxypeptidase [Candidatus Rickettsia vulgarisii]